MRELIRFIQLVIITILCSRGLSNSLKIIGKALNNKTTTEMHDVPYLVRLDYIGEFGKHFLCSATLIHPRFVVTAAHCLNLLTNETITVTAKNTFLSNSTSEAPQVTNIFIPEEYFEDRNIAVLKIDKPLATDEKYIKSIELCNLTIKSGNKLQISGYGRQLTKSTAISRPLCAKYFDGKVNITQNMFCGMPEKHMNVCDRDVGGPVTYKGKLCGIMLWADGWFHTRSPEVYFNTKYVNAFIKDILASK